MPAAIDARDAKSVQGLTVGAPIDFAKELGDDKKLPEGEQKYKDISGELAMVNASINSHLLRAQLESMGDLLPIEGEEKFDCKL
eukprot:9772130-Alexandrium_andersonii.AAC.1